MTSSEAKRRGTKGARFYTFRGRTEALREREARWLEWYLLRQELRE